MTSAVIGALRVTLGLDSAAFDKGIKEATGKLGQVGGQLKRVGAGLTSSLSGPLAAAGAAVGAAMTLAANNVEELKNAARISNADFEEFQKLALAARTVGIESEKLADIYKDVNDKVGEFIATGGGEMADFFENVAPKVGLTADEFARLSGPEALQAYFNALQNAGLSQQQMTFYMEAIADEATALIPLLANSGAKFEELGRKAAESGQVISSEAAAGTLKYKEAMRDLSASIQSLTVAVANSGVIEFFTKIVSGATSLAQELSKINPAIVKWTAAIAGIGVVIGPAAIAIGVLATAAAAISAPVWAAIAAVAAVTAGITALWQAIQIAHPYLQKLSGEVWDAITTKVAETKIAIQQFATDIVATFKAIPGQMMAIGKDIIDGLWSGLKSTWDGLKGGVRSIAGSVEGIFRDEAETHSPSRVMMRVGQDVMSGLGMGMENMSGQVTDIAGKIAATVSNAFQGLIDGSKTVKDVISDLLGQLSQMLIHEGFRALTQGIFGGGMGGGGGFFGGLIGGIGKLFGFANGGQFQVGGAGGIDSQLVAFKASPNETVTVTKPGQEMSRTGMHITVGVATDGNGNLMPFVQDVARREAAGITRAGIQQHDQQLQRNWSARTSMAQMRQA